MCKKKICGCGDPTHDFVQIQSDWEQTDISKPDYILNKPTFKTINGETILGTGDIEVEATIIPATYTTLGGVIVDSSTLSISEAGVITVIGGGSGGGNTNIGGSLVDFNLNLTSSTGSGTTIDLSPMFSNYYDIDQIDELFEEIQTFYNSNGIITTDRNVNFSGFRLVFENAMQYRFSTVGIESTFTLREDRGIIKVGTTEFFVNPDSIQIGTTNSSDAYVKLFIDNITDSRQVQFQDKDGTIAYLDDIIGYTLPIASSTILGGVKTNVGSGVTVHPTTGVISANNLYRTDGTLLGNRNVMGDGKYINFYGMASFNLSDRDSIMVDVEGTSFSFNFGGISENSTARFRTSLLTDNRIFQMPNQSGTFALLSDIIPYSLPIASSAVLGGIKVGAGLTIAGDGTLSASVDTELFIIVTSLPVTGLENKIYLVPMTSPEVSNEYEEWIWIDEEWEKIGELNIDLSDYYTKTEIDSLFVSNAYELPIATTSILGGVKGGGNVNIGVDGTLNVSGFVPTSRTITINGVTYDLSENRTWTVDTIPTDLEFTYFSSNYVALETDNNKVLYYTGTTDVTLKIPATLNEGWNAIVIQGNIGKVTIISDGTVQQADGLDTTRKQFSTASILREDSNKVLISGDFEGDEPLFVLPIATDEILGGVMIGDGIDVDSNGTISIDLSNYYDKTEIDEMFEDFVMENIYTTDGTITGTRNVLFGTGGFLRIGASTGNGVLGISANGIFSNMGDSNFSLQENSHNYNFATSSNSGVTYNFGSSAANNTFTVNNLNTFSISARSANVASSIQMYNWKEFILEANVIHLQPVDNKLKINTFDHTFQNKNGTVAHLSDLTALATLYSADGTISGNRQINGNGMELYLYDLADFEVRVIDVNGDENVLNMNQANISFQYEIDDVLASSYTFGKEGPMMLLGNALQHQFEINSGYIMFGLETGKKTSILNTNVTTVRNYELPDKSGTFALLDDVSKFATVDSKTTAYTLVDEDCGKVLRFTNSANINVTVPQTLTLGFNVTIVQEGTGKLTFVASGSANIDNVDSKYTTRGIFSSVSICKTQTGTTGQVIIAGDLE